MTDTPSAPRTDVLSPEQRHALMRRIGRENTRSELALRRLFHGAGFRYRLSYPGLPHRPDLVFPGRRVAVFVHGCFWHGHGCPLFKWPHSNSAFWSAKIRRNITRDCRVIQAFLERGWRCLTVWECALRGPGKLPCDELLAATGRFLADTDERTREISGPLPIRNVG